MSAELAVESNRPPVYRDYSPEFKAEVIAQVKASNGNVFRVAEECQVPIKTLQYWIHQEERYSQFRQQKQEDLATKYEANLHRLTDSIADHNLESATLQAKATAVGILTEKMLLLRGQPTSITASVDKLDISIILQSALEEALGNVIDIEPE